MQRRIISLVEVLVAGVWDAVCAHVQVDLLFVMPVMMMVPVMAAVPPAPMPMMSMMMMFGGFGGSGRGICPAPSHRLKGGFRH